MSDTPKSKCATQTLPEVVGAINRALYEIAELRNALNLVLGGATGECREEPIPTTVASISDVLEAADRLQVVSYNSVREMKHAILQIAGVEQ